jgi:hypothetical protein
MTCRGAASIPVVGFNAILMSEHFGAFFAFGILHAALAIRYIKVKRATAPCFWYKFSTDTVFRRPGHG